MGRLTGRAAPPIPAGQDKAHAVRSMFDAIAPRYDLVNRIISMGLDMGWRRRAVRALALEPGSVVADLACGTGDFCRVLERAGHRPIGFDFAAGMLAKARTAAPLVQADVLALPVADGALDGVTCGFALRNVSDLSTLFAEVVRVLRPGGRFAFVEVAEPERRLVRFGHGLYFNRVVPLIGGLLSDRDAYRYLPRSVVYLPAPERVQEMLEAAGLTRVRRVTLSGGIAQLILGMRR